ncbi:MAG: hypothetical protein O3A88_01285 [Proteobacteria bacterium]|nr:hypothetical protein [Pseudomonadota bacterium]
MAASKAAKAAHRSVEITERTARRQLRAYLGVLNAEVKLSNLGTFKLSWKSTTQGAPQLWM